MTVLYNPSLLYPTGNLPEPVKGQEYMRRFSKMIQEDSRVRTQIVKLLSPDCTCKRAEECVVSDNIRRHELVTAPSYDSSTADLPFIYFFNIF